MEHCLVGKCIYKLKEIIIALDLYKKCTLRLKDVTKNQMEQEKTVIFESKRRQELQKEVQTLKDDLSTQYALSHRRMSFY